VVNSLYYPGSDIRYGLAVLSGELSEFGHRLHCLIDITGIVEQMRREAAPSDRRSS
jgi:hypothetical protein